MKKKIEFEFELDQIVTNPLGTKGVIVMFGYDGEGKKYYVQETNGSNWWKEDQLIISGGQPIS